MNIQRIDSKKLALVVERSKLEIDGRVDMEKAQALVEDAFGGGLPGKPNVHMELQAFTGSDTVLIFACLIETRFQLCRFKSFDDLAQAAKALELCQLKNVELYYRDGEYLAVSPTAYPPSISEYGDVWALDTAERAYFVEHLTRLSPDIFNSLGY